MRTATPGSNYKLWTTLKVPQGYSMRKHCEFLAKQTGAEKFILLPAKKLFALGYDLAKVTIPWRLTPPGGEPGEEEPSRDATDILPATKKKR